MLKKMDSSDSNTKSMDPCSKNSSTFIDIYDLLLIVKNSERRLYRGTEQLVFLDLSRLNQRNM